MTRLNALVIMFALALPSLGSAQESQVNRVRFNVLLTPSNETPPVVGVDAGGEAVVSILLTHTPAGDDVEGDCGDADGLCDDTSFVDPSDIGEVTAATVDFLVNYAFGSEQSVRAMHIHRGVLGVGGPVVINSQLGGPFAAMGSGSFFRSVTVSSPMDLAVIQEILANPGAFYLNVHTAANPAGLLRGQLRNTPEVISGRDQDAAAEAEQRVLAKLSLIQATLDRIRVENLAHRDTTNRIASRLGILPVSPDAVDPGDLSEVEVPCTDDDEDGEDDETGEPCNGN